MKYRTMRFIGGEENVSLLGLGCMRFPLKEDGTIDEVQAEAMIERAINGRVSITLIQRIHIIREKVSHF